MSRLQVFRPAGVVGAACAALVLLAGCLQGYPHNAGLLIPVEAMSQRQRLDALNEVGDLYYLGERWRYKLNKQCQLRVTTGTWLSAKHSDWIPLTEVRIVRAFDKTDKTHDILIEQSAPIDSRPAVVPLLAGAQWADTVHVMSVAYHMQQGCSRNA